MADTQGVMGASGEIELRRLRNLHSLESYVNPVTLGWKVRNFLRGNWWGTVQHVATEMSGRLLGTICLSSTLSGLKFTPNWGTLYPEQVTKLKGLLADNIDVRELVPVFGGSITDYGVLSYRVVTDTGVQYLANAMSEGTATAQNLKYHGFGTGTATEGTAQTALQTELTTHYAVDNTRPTGSQSVASNIYTTIGTLSPDSGGTIAITEHGIFS